MKLATVVLFCALVVCVSSVPTSDQQFADGNKLFTAAVYKELLKTGDENILVSPLSAQIVLALTQSGAKDETAAQIRNGLSLLNSDQETRAAIDNLLTTLKSDREYTLHTANKVYVKRDLPLKDEFKEVASRVYRADLENIDFSKKKEAAATINKWVEEQTENKIHNLVSPDVLGPSAALLLVNALYFQGSWTNTFKDRHTNQSDFYKTLTDVIRVDTMHSKGELYGYYEDPKLQVKYLEMHFNGKGASMVIVLPNEKDGLAALESQLDQVFSPPKFPYDIVDVALPKFKIESKTDFKKILQNLGVHKAFELGEADLSGIAGEKGDLAVSQVIQKAFIGVDEEGVEAAAATFVLPVLGSVGPQVKPPKKFVADHPFIFFIKVNDAILFAGRVVAP
ncbi:Serpin domain containing protein [Asbolus verrucosus]|uniref:Serpin domain containing protein n=1 Tax=Asbolus verrucosus TaxID=1661398 RepID=A0A482VA08_ASBVE|nr:Serpin domain containing protein [Asbolus verrucosus]